ncbi:MAG: T9SS type A sorting domain-containing protein [Flavobacteriales bacterium]|nr:T9SS type A sorting domain-containing protein [Flavobacteriales bacterium]
MRKLKLMLTLFALIPMSHYAQVISDLGIEVTAVIDGVEHQFEVTDGSYPPYDPDVEIENAYSYFWHTDEGHISNADKPIFFFASEGEHHVYLVLTPRKQGDEVNKVFTTLTYLVDVSNTSNASHGIISDIDMYVDGQARYGDKIYVVVPLISCAVPGMTGISHTNKIGYDHTKLKFLNLLSQTNLELINILPEGDAALGVPLSRKLSFNYGWSTIRDDIAVVIEFEVMTPEIEDPIGLKFEKDILAFCDSDVEINFLSIHGPYDPNYKESNISEVNVFENPDKKISATEVIYTIHFQNVGEAPVDSVTIFDTLPNHLTFVSFEGSSEPSMIVNTNHTAGVLKWVIAPDADIKGTNQSPTEPEPTTKGWVSFKAEISKEEVITYDICHCLSNVATIYFDSLAPITTAADIITIGDALCFSPDINSQTGLLYAETICGSSVGDSISSASSTRLKSKKEEITFIAYPNPSNGAVQLKGELEKIRGIEVLNYLGQKVLSLSKYENSISFDNQASGLYFIRIVTEEEQQVIRIEKY